MIRPFPSSAEIREIRSFSLLHALGLALMGLGLIGLLLSLMTGIPN